MPQCLPSDLQPHSAIFISLSSPQKHPLFPETLSLTLLSLLLLIIWESAQMTHPPEDFSVFPLLQVGLWLLLCPGNVPSLWFYLPHCTVIIAQHFWPLVLLLPWGWTPYLFPNHPHLPPPCNFPELCCLIWQPLATFIYWSFEMWLVRIEMCCKTHWILKT